MLQDAAELGANAALSKAGVLKPYLSKEEANRMYGRVNVDRWIAKGHIEAIKDGNNTSKCRIDRVQIEAIAKTANRHSYNLVKTK